MTLKVRSSGSWVVPTTVKAKDAGTWKQVQTVWAKLSGVWTAVWVFGTLGWSGGTAAAKSGSGVQTCTVSIERSGYVDLTNGTDGYWVSPASATVGDSFYVKWDHVSGNVVTPSSGWTEGVWLDISTARELALTMTTVGGKYTEVDFSFGAISGSADFVQRVSLSAQRTS